MSIEIGICNDTSIDTEYVVTRQLKQIMNDFTSIETEYVMTRMTPLLKQDNQ